MRPRDYALLQLDAKHLPNWANDVFRQHPTPRDRPVDPRDLALAEHITVGVVKNLFLLQFLTEHYSSRKLSDIDIKVQKILAVGLYQLKFMDRIPPSAAVNEAVEQAKRGGCGQAAGFVNAVLRRATRESTAILPDHENEPEEYARIVLSHPPEVYRRLRELVSSDGEALDLCEHNNDEPPTIVRLYPGKCADHLGNSTHDVIAHQFPGFCVVIGAKQAQLADWSDREIAQVQDPTAAAVIEHCGIEDGHHVLDRCCGLGTKTLQILQRCGKKGKIVAIDPSAMRTKTLKALLEKRKIDNIAVIQSASAESLPPELPEKFHCVLADVPCSNSGVLSRRPEARYHQDDATLDSLHKLQQTILKDSALRVAPGGKLVYSTCSIWPSENQKLVERFLNDHSDFQLVKEQATLPLSLPDHTHYRDGGYVAVMTRG